MIKVFLDIETTGLNYKKNDKIIEIFCLKIKKNLKNNFHYYINPETKISDEAYQIHGIKNDFLKNKPKFKDICKKLLNFIKNSILIIHNTKFDLNFINFQLKKEGFKKLQFYCYKIIDTLKFSKKFYNSKKNSLDFLCKKFNIYKHSERVKHSASLDVFLLYNIYIKFLEDFKVIKIIKIKNFSKKIKNLNFFKNKMIVIFSKNKENVFNNFIINKKN